MAAPDPFFAIANYVEAAVWGLIACAFAVAAVRRPAVRARCALAAVTFALFGLSDVVEVRTGAWWRPWWLLAWNGACVAVLGVLLIDHLRRRSPAWRERSAATRLDARRENPPQDP